MQRLSQYFNGEKPTPPPHGSFQVLHFPLPLFFFFFPLDSNPPYVFLTFLSCSSFTGKKGMTSLSLRTKNARWLTTKGRADWSRVSMKAAVIYSATFEKLRVEQRYKGAPFKLSNACTPLRETSKFRLIIFALRSFVFFFFFFYQSLKRCSLQFLG